MARKLCILAAGRGTRVASQSNTPHKALISLAGKAVISHILEKFPVSNEVVVALGHEGDLVKEYLEAAHPEREFQFVRVQNYAGEGSGPGQSLLECEPFLRAPFVLVCADTLWTEELPFSARKNEIYFAKHVDEATEKYCNILFDSQFKVQEIQDKKKIRPANNNGAFIGLANIADWEIFFSGLKKSKALIAGESQISSGLQYLLAGGNCVAVAVHSWLDTGNPEGLKFAENKLGSTSFKKRDEEIYFVGDRVVKYYANEEICRLRILRSKLDQDILPPCVFEGKHFYAYTFIPGVTIRDLDGTSSLSEVLHFAKQKLWISRTISFNSEILCKIFYLEKTRARLELFRIHSPPDLFTRIEKVFSSWNMEDFSTKAKFVRIHGDFQVGNIICTNEDPFFALIDFRQEFAGRTDIGDMYYDLGKLYASIWIDYLALARAENIEDLVPKKNYSSLSQSMQDFANTEGLDFTHIKRMALLIYFNMMGLHDERTSRLLACKALELHKEL